MPDTFNDAATSKDEPAPGLTISVQPEQRLFEANQKVLLVPRRGQVTATACITNTVQAGQVFVPMHYSVANDLAFPAFDPYSRQPAYKACAVSVTPL